MQHKIDEISRHVEYETIIFNENFIMYSDQDRILQILINFLTNAAKFTSEGSIKFVVKADEHNLIMEIVDTGSGVSPNLKSQIFKKQFVGNDGPNIRGIGIGLYLCNMLAHRLGACISFDTEVNKGSTFRIIFDLTKIKCKTIV